MNYKSKIPSWTQFKLATGQTAEICDRVRSALYAWIETNYEVPTKMTLGADLVRGSAWENSRVAWLEIFGEVPYEIVPGDEIRFYVS